MKVIRFHVAGRAYTWSPASRAVFDNYARLVARDCFTLDDARTAVETRLGYPTTI